MKDPEIIQRIQNRDESAIDYLYSKYFKMMARMIIRNSGSEEEAKDIYQDSLIVFWEKVIKDELTLTSKISTYLYSICQNLWRKELVRKRRLSNEEKDSPVEPVHDQNERIQIIRNCVNEMSETCRKVLSLYYFDKFSMKDIATELNFASPDTAKTKKYKCKKQLDALVKSRYTLSDFID